MKENKFVMGEEEEISKPPSSNNNKKQPTRHHVKRRSSGRVHVAKLAPMARANSSAAAHTDSEADLMNDDNTNNDRPVMRRSQSQRSLHRMSLDRKGFTTLTRRKSNSIENNKPLDMTASVQQPEEEPPIKKSIDTKETSNTSSTHSSSNPASLSSRMIAAPVEQTFNAVANTLVIPKKSIYSTIVPPTSSSSSKRADSVIEPTIKKKQPLRSQFIASSYEEPSSSSFTKPDFHMTPSRTNSTNSISQHTKPNSSSLSRTQQKLMLQKQQSQVDDETSPIHPRNMQKINKELEQLSKENRCIKRYEDPMRASLIRCLEKSNGKVKNPALSRLQLGANKHSVSTSHVPTTANTASNNKQQIPHLEQRQMAHQHHHLKSIALSRSVNHNTLEDIDDHNCSSANNTNPFWNATTALLDRMFNSS